MNKLREVLTYSADLSGRRRLRTYVRAALFIAVALLVILAFALGQKNETQRAMAAVATIHYETLPTQPQGPSPTPETCPSDPGGWQFVGSGIPGDQLERMEPACVYAGLGRTIAWVLAIREGYNRAEAAQAMGFVQLPAQTRMSTIQVIDPVGNPWVASLVMAPLTGGYSEWHIDGEGRPAEEYIPQGCFRGMDMRSGAAGENTQIRNGSYPVICYIIQADAATHTILSLNGHVFSVSSSPTCSLLYFGYSTGTKQWDWLGIDVKFPYANDVAGKMGDPNNYSGQYGGSVWNAGWLLQTYGLAMKALPDHWQTAHDQVEMKAILDSINSFNAP